MKIKTSINVETSFTRFTLPDGNGHWRGTRAATFTMPNKVSGAGGVTTTLFLN